MQHIQQQQQQQPVQQYTITLDGKTLKTNQIHYKIEPTGTLTFQEPQYVQQTQPAPTQHTTIRYRTPMNRNWLRLVIAYRFVFFSVTTHIPKSMSFWSSNRPMQKSHKYWNAKSLLWKLSRRRIKSQRLTWFWLVRQCNSSKGFKPTPVSGMIKRTASDQNNNVFYSLFVFDSYSTTTG